MNGWERSGDGAAWWHVEVEAHEGRRRVAVRGWLETLPAAPDEALTVYWGEGAHTPTETVRWQAVCRSLEEPEEFIARSGFSFYRDEFEMLPGDDRWFLYWSEAGRFSLSWRDGLALPSWERFGELLPSLVAPRSGAVCLDVVDAACPSCRRTARLRRAVRELGWMFRRAQPVLVCPDCGKWCRRSDVRRA
jgi:hypothetical protein